MQLELMERTRVPEAAIVNLKARRNRHMLISQLVGKEVFLFPESARLAYDPVKKRRVIVMNFLPKSINMKPEIYSGLVLRWDEIVPIMDTCRFLSDVVAENAGVDFSC